MFVQILVYGIVVGIIHFVIMGALYANPLVDKIYKHAQATEPSVRKWPSMPIYLITQFLGTQVEIYILTFGYIWLRELTPFKGIKTAFALGFLFAAIRIYPRFWNMWIQSTYPKKMLWIEFINGVIGTLIVTNTLEILL